MTESGEAAAIAQSERPATPASLAADLRSLGLARGATVMVHSSLSRLGFVVGGPQAVVSALLDVIGDSGTLMMPTHSSGLSDPAGWQNPPVPESWWPAVRDEMPAYDPQLTPTRAMGAIVECFRHVPGVQRSAHPAVSAAAVGPNAAQLVGGHELDDGNGESSPQARLHELDGHVLLLGVSHANNTSLHLSEYRADLAAERATDGAPITVDGERRWQTFSYLDEDESDFGVLGEAFAATRLETRGNVGTGVGRLMRSRDIVDFGVTWMRSNRATA